MANDVTISKSDNHAHDIFDVSYARRRAQRIQPAHSPRTSGVQAGKTCRMNSLNLIRHLKSFRSDEAAG
jgi:hypothetical protein